MTRQLDRRRFTAAAAAVGLGGSRRLVRRGGAGGRSSARLQRPARPLGGAGDRLRSHPGRRPVFEPRHRPHLRGLARLRPARGADPAGAAHGRGDARGLGRLQDLDRAPAARHPLRRRSGLQGPAARAGRRRLRLLVQARLRPGDQEPELQLAERRRHRRPRRRAPARAARQEAVRLPRARSRACARSIATRCSSSWPRRGRASRRRSARRTRSASRAKWSRPTATTSWRTRSAPGRTG